MDRDNYIAELPFGRPDIDEEAFVAPTAVVVGAVTLGARSSIWYGSVARADEEAIVIGPDTNVQDGCALHSDPGFPLVVGRGVTVGRPLGLLLTRRSENATVTLCHTGTRDLAAHVRDADIVVAAAGVPGIITGEMVKPGAAVLDVGVSRVDGKLAGDVDQSVYDVAGWVSPNPGGVGPMTRAMLLSNVVAAAEADLGSSAPA